MGHLATCQLEYIEVGIGYAFSTPVAEIPCILLLTDVWKLFRMLGAREIIKNELR